MKWLDVLLRRRPEHEETAKVVDTLKAESDRTIERADRVTESYRRADLKLRRR